MDQVQKENFVIAYNSAKNLKKNLVDMYSVSSACEVPDVFVSEWAMRNIDTLARMLGELERVMPAVTGQSGMAQPTKDVAGETFPDNLSKDVTRQIQKRLFDEIGTNAGSLYRSLDNISSVAIRPGFDIFINDWASHNVRKVVAPILRGHERLRLHLDPQWPSANSKKGPSPQ